MEGVKAEQSRALAGVMAALNDGFANEASGQKRKACSSPAEDEAAKRRRFLETLLEGDDSGEHLQSFERNYDRTVSQACGLSRNTQVPLTLLRQDPILGTHFESNRRLALANTLRPCCCDTNQALLDELAIAQLQ